MEKYCPIKKDEESETIDYYDLILRDKYKQK